MTALNASVSWGMKTQLLVIASAAVLLQGCTTYTTPDGRVQSSMNPAAASVLETALSSGMGVASGALMQNSPSWATGGVGGAVGSVGTQLVSALVQGAQGQPASYGSAQGYYQNPAPAQYYRAGGGYQQPQYPQYPRYPQYPQYPQGGGYGGYY